MQKPKIAIITSFFEWSTAYSLTSVVENQLSALVKYGYDPVFFVLPGFKDDYKVPKGVVIRKVIPQIILEPYHAHCFDKYAPIPKNHNEDVKRVIVALEENMKDIDVAITHDFMLVDDYAPYAEAIAKVNLPKVRWLHWIHSSASGRLPDDQMIEPWQYQYQLNKDAKIVYLNSYDVVSVAERYATYPDNVRVVHNSIDARTFFKPDDLVVSMINQFGLLNADIVQTYPVSTPRMVDNKQVHKLIKIFGKLKEQGEEVRLIVCNAHANAEKEKNLIAEMQRLANDCGLDPAREVIFTSKINPPKYEQGVPHNIVKDLFLLSNLFVFPTTSENAPLILLEAASARNLLVLNDDFPPLREFFGQNALYFKFSSARQKTKYDDEEKYLDDVARIIRSELTFNRPLNVFKEWKQKFNFDTIFLKEIEPLFYKDMIPEP